MPIFRFRVRDRSRGLLAEAQIEEKDISAATRSIIAALAIFTLSQGFQPDATVEVDDDSGTPVVRMNMKGEIQ